MFRRLKQASAAVSMLNPREVRILAAQTVSIGLVASGESAYAEMEEFLRARDAGQVHRAGEPNPPETVDLILYEEGMAPGKGIHTFHRGALERTVAEILDAHEDLALPLARQFPPFRKAVVESTIHAVSRENALFAIATALPNVVPNLIELPWLFGEFASDTVFLTANQIRMAFVIAAACGREAGFGQQRAEIVSMAAGAFGWRALARELAGKIPLGEGLIPKGAIAYAGTYVIGKGLEYLYHANVPYTDEQRVTTYRRALERGKSIAASLRLKGSATGG